MTQIDDDVHARPENVPDELPQARGGPVIEVARREAPETRG
jgi:hypothetical protein